MRRFALIAVLVLPSSLAMAEGVESQTRRLGFALGLHGFSYNYGSRGPEFFAGPRLAISYWPAPQLLVTSDLSVSWGKHNRGPTDGPMFGVKAAFRWPPINRYPIGALLGCGYSIWQHDWSTVRHLPQLVFGIGYQGDHLDLQWAWEPGLSIHLDGDRVRVDSRFVFMAGIPFGQMDTESLPKREATLRLGVGGGPYGFLYGKSQTVFAGGPRLAISYWPTEQWVLALDASMVLVEGDKVGGDDGPMIGGNAAFRWPPLHQSSSGLLLGVGYSVWLQKRTSHLLRMIVGYGFQSDYFDLRFVWEPGLGIIPDNGLHKKPFSDIWANVVSFALLVGIPITF